jgi:predicted regulator of Ras-like GTPase activity (Roadblock/LC7/MglB family)
MGKPFSSVLDRFRRLRGVTCVAIIATEGAFWYDAETGSTNADVEILNAVRPTLATTGGPHSGRRIGRSPGGRSQRSI